MIDQLMVGKFLLHKQLELLKQLYLHNVQQMHLCKMFDQCLIDRSLLHKQFEL